MKKPPPPPDTRSGYAFLSADDVDPSERPQSSRTESFLRAVRNPRRARSNAYGSATSAVQQGVGWVGGLNRQGLNDTLAYCRSRSCQFLLTRLLCVPICLLFFLIPVLWCARFVDENIPTVGAAPVSAKEIGRIPGFTSMSFVHLYYGKPETWAPAPPPSG